MTDPQPPSTAVRPASGLPWLLTLAVGTLLCRLCTLAPVMAVFGLALFSRMLGPFYAYDPETGSGLYVNGSPTVSAETAHVIDAYLDAMTQGDAATAYALYSRHTQAVITLEDLERVLTGPDFVQYSGYRAVTVEEVSTDSLAGLPQWAVVSGRVIYTGDSVGNYEATLVREGGEWRLSTITLHLPPEKLGPTGVGGRGPA